MVASMMWNFSYYFGCLVLSYGGHDQDPLVMPYHINSALGCRPMFNLVNLKIIHARFQLKSKNKLKVDEWYHVQIERRMKEGEMKIDNQTTIYGKSHGRSRGMNIHSPIYFGGTNSKSKIFFRNKLMQRILKQLTWHFEMLFPRSIFIMEKFLWYWHWPCARDLQKYWCHVTWSHVIRSNITY